MFKIEVAYARSDSQLIIELEVEEGATIEEAISSSGILLKFPEIDLSVNKVGVFGKQMALERPVREGERIEIYRGLVADPKQARRRQARAQ
ncbi:MAG TPA: RnfH family protein [Gammaproteobacteria bacterium]|nr:RnfH family protein [Gammaproteobacteria bacterium]